MAESARRLGVLSFVAALVVALVGHAPVATAGSAWVASWATSPVAGTEVPGSSRPAGRGLRDLTSRGSRSVVIGAGEQAVSDPVALDVPALSTLLVSVWTRTCSGRPDPGRERWIRGSGEFDAVADFAAATAAPDDVLRFAPAYGSGDGLHPNDRGTQAMADAVWLPDLTGH